MDKLESLIELSEHYKGKNELYIGLSQIHDILVELRELRENKNEQT